jgi:uncharacterized protein (UPF0548 family)
VISSTGSASGRRRDTGGQRVLSPLTYPEVGATRDGPLPAGYRHLRYRTPLGAGVFDVAADAVLTWRMHRAAGVRVTASAPRAEVGVTLVSGLGVGPLRLNAPSEVVWVVDDGRRAGFGYGSLAGHPARGEEAFLVERGDDGQVWFSVTAFSRPAGWLMRGAGPAAVAVQHAYVRRCGAVLRRLCRE